jgi:hypothetical protein
MAFGLRKSLDLALAAFEIVRVMFRHGPKIGIVDFPSKSEMRKQLIATYAPFTGYFDAEPVAAPKTNRLRRAMEEDGSLVHAQPLTLLLRLYNKLLHELSQTAQFREQLVDRMLRESGITLAHAVLSSTVLSGFSRSTGAARLFLRQDRSGRAAIPPDRVVDIHHAV